MGNDFHTLADEYLLSACFLSCLPASIYFGIVLHIYKYKYIKCQDTQQNCDFSSGKSKLQSLQKSKICTGKILNLTSRDHNFVFPRILCFFSTGRIWNPTRFWFVPWHIHVHLPPYWTLPTKRGGMCHSLYSPSQCLHLRIRKGLSCLTFLLLSCFHKISVCSVAAVVAFFLFVFC